MLVPHPIVLAATVITLHNKLVGNAQRVVSLGIWPTSVVLVRIRLFKIKLQYRGMLLDSHRVRASIVESMVISATIVRGWQIRMQIRT
ncbi:hypothetical protein HanXRQr2_Chr02g0054001 [Helianthus annuus]|uniref:Uncharacterized protein n=1 Tax=Helianthus annuus TaxID=4232 RepID=A0A9K3NY32_HELAN|nr:hypothetical protein HanXRQr2_Chr02g0054001 [Helianthus annuus]